MNEKTTCHQKYKKKASEILFFFRAKSILRALNSQSGTSCVWHLHLPFREDRSGGFLGTEGDDADTTLFILLPSINHGHSGNRK